MVGGVARGSRIATLVMTTRWITVAVGVLLATTTASAGVMAIAGALVIHAAWRTWRPVGDRSDRAVVPVVGEIALVVAAVVSTGWWQSPFLLTLLAPIGAVQHARTVARTAEERGDLALSRLSALAEVNSLLADLHRIAQTLPVSLDLTDTVTSLTTSLRELFEPNVAVVLLRDDTRHLWLVAHAAGARLFSTLRDDELPAPAREALDAGRTTLVPELGHQRSGFGPSSATGIYAPLVARSRTVGLVAVERVVPGMLTERDQLLLDALVEQMAMAVDNARWFARLRRMGADEERSRIARELHDRVGQALAYLAFELDRVAGTDTDDLRGELATLAEDVRHVLAETRDTLHDLRTDVSPTHDLVETVEEFLSRVERRTGLSIDFTRDASARLPLPVERELWGIAQEAVSNVERHARARALHVRFTCTDAAALLEVSDDGAGMATPSMTRPGAYGIVGMRERADAIGAQLEIRSEPGSGTTVRCVLERQ